MDFPGSKSLTVTRGSTNGLPYINRSQAVKVNIEALRSISNALLTAALLAYDITLVCLGGVVASHVLRDVTAFSYVFFPTPPFFLLVSTVFFRPDQHQHSPQDRRSILPDLTTTVANHPLKMFQNFINILLQLCLASLAFAAPVAQEVTASTAGNSWQYGTGGGVIGFIVLILDIIVFST